MIKEGEERVEKEAAEVEKQKNDEWKQKAEGQREEAVKHMQK